MKKYICSKTLIFVSILATTAQVAAAGFQLNSQSATGLGRAFAGDAVIADNASVMARNSAAMTLFDKNAISLGFTTVDSKITLSDATYNDGTMEEEIEDYDNAGGIAGLPNLHLIVPMNNKLSLGFDSYSNFATKTSINNNYAAREFGGSTALQTANFGFAAAYRINDQWSLGGGLDVIYGSGKLKRSLPRKIQNPAVEGSLIHIDVDGWGLGFNLGSVFELNKNNRFGLAYHYSPKITATGDFYGVHPAVKGAKELFVPLPDLLEFSGYHKLSNTKFAIHYSVEWIGWSAFDALRTDKGTVKEYKWKDTYHFAIGSTYYLNNRWTLRTGYMYDLSAQDEIKSISVPDSDRQWFSTGVTYQLNQTSNVDFGFTYLLGQNTKVNEKIYWPAVQTTTEINATTRANAILLGLQYSLIF